MMLIYVFYQFILFIGDPIFLRGFKLGDEVPELSILGAINIENFTDGDFILDDSHQ